MKCTFLIGNGFDLNLGLKTSFSSFFSKYCEENNNDSEAVKIFKQAIQADLEAWSDFELQMGAFTNHVKPNGDLSKEEYFACMEDFRNQLVEYLKKEENKISKDELDFYAYKTFAPAIKMPFEYLRTGGKLRLRNAIQCFKDDIVNYSFIVFNYTNTFDRCLASIGYNNIEGINYRGNFAPESDSHRRIEHMFYDVEGAETISVDDNAGSYAKDSIIKVIHVHGQIGEAILMGLNDDQQVANQALADDIQFKCNYIKPISNTLLNELRDQEAEEIINQSDIIIIFGMSIGQTDGYWWKCIADWLSSSSNNDFLDRCLIVFSYDPNRNRNSPNDNRENQEEIRDRILAWSKTRPNEGKQDIRNKIVCSLNSGIFNPDF